jgi:hypothetical protein
VVLALVFSLALSVEATPGETGPENPASASEGSGGEVLSVQLEEDAAEPQTHAGRCLLCYTCGSSWPYARVYIYQSSSTATYERGSGCGGSHAWRHDPRPNYCCNY